MTNTKSIPTDPVGQVQNETPKLLPHEGRLWPHDGKVISLQSARIYAKMAHQGQTDKSGKPYIEHLSRVARSVQYMGQEDIEIVAWLHDVMEDRLDLVEDIRGRVSAQVADALVWLAREPEDDYEDYIRCICHYGNELAIAVKLADLFDHLRYGAWNVLTPGQTQRYIDAIAIIHRSQQSSDKAVTHEG